MSKTEAQALWIVSERTAEIRTEPLREPGAGEVLVKTLVSAVSRGTESLVFEGRVPKSEWQRMRAPHQAGEFPWPVKYGYASVGRVLEGSEALVGRVVFCLFPHQDYFVVPEHSVMPVPHGVPSERAVLAANLETALNAVWDAPVLVGDRVSVVGAGLVGSLVTFLGKAQPGVEIELVDINEDRQSVAEAFGARFSLPEAASIERDLVFHASASEAGLKTALRLPGVEGCVVELSWYGDRAVTLNLGSEFHVKRLRLRSSQVGSVSPHARPRYGFRERLALALELCRDARLDVLFEPDVAFADLPQHLPNILGPEARALCQRVRYA